VYYVLPVNPATNEPRRDKALCVLV
jgi:hypothetical protein